MDEDLLMAMLSDIQNQLSNLTAETSNVVSEVSNVFYSMPNNDALETKLDEILQELKKIRRQL